MNGNHIRGFSLAEMIQSIFPSCKFLHSHKILLFCLVTDVTCLLSVNRSYMNYVVCVPMHITDVLHAQLCIILSIVTI